MGNRIGKRWEGVRSISFGFGRGHGGIQEKPRHMETQSRHKCRNICIAITILLISLLVVAVILALTLLKPKRPITTVNSVAVDRTSASLDPARMEVLINLTLHLHLSLRNPNRVGFTYAPSSGVLNYRGQEVGEAPLPAGHMAPMQTVPMNLNLTLMADRLLSQPQLLSDVMSDALPLNTFVKLSGRVRVLSIFSFHLKSSSSCDLKISISGRNITHQECRYSTKL